jgi:hypothetical protein
MKTWRKSWFYRLKQVDFFIGSLALNPLADYTTICFPNNFAVNPAYSELPAFLVKDGGLNSGFMLAHCTAAALVSENKTLCHPASVDSLSTSAGTEDHVSMGGFAARKCLQVSAWSRNFTIRIFVII